MNKFLMLLLMFNIALFSSCKDECVEITWYADTDGDTFGDANNTLDACEQPAGYVSNSDDLDDTQSGVSTISNQDKALALLAAFSTGEPTVLDYVSDEMYTQHNLAFPDGKDAIVPFFSGTPNGIDVTNHAVFTDNSNSDIVILFSTYGGSWGAVSGGGSDQVAFDVFRFENGLIVEHWDNLIDLADPTTDAVNGNTQVNGITTPTDLDDTEANKSLVSDMVDNILIDGQYSTNADYFSPDYIQHSPGVPNGTDWLSGIPDGTPFYASRKFIYGLGNYVVAMSEGVVSPDTGLATAYYDLFRIEDGLIKEHWDTQQVIPDMADWANTNGKW